MSCRTCGADMILMNVVQESTEAVRGFERHILRCSGCGVTERRAVFTRHGREDDSEPLPMHAAPAIVPASAAKNIVAPGLLGRLVARIGNY
jgi:hypothetical protein